jgi:hypothetical protein
VAAVRDGIEGGNWESHRPKLDYPFEHAPKIGEAIDVGPGVKWLRMPLGGLAGWINVWAARDGDGWAIVDTGIGGLGHPQRLARGRWPGRWAASR